MMRSIASELPGRLALAAFGLEVDHLQADRPRHPADDLVLHLQNASPVGIEAFGPQLIAVHSIHQLRIDAHTLALEQDAAAERIAHVQLAADLPHIAAAGPVGKGGGARHHEAPGSARDKSLVRLSFTPSATWSWRRSPLRLTNGRTTNDSAVALCRSTDDPVDSPAVAVMLFGLGFVNGTYGDASHHAAVTSSDPRPFTMIAKASLGASRRQIGISPASVAADSFVGSPEAGAFPPSRLGVD
jgi:hypothetical protein